ncbi:unnamed protein product [Brachionus calyciflorus]|uniref:Rap guanine nucleotide exchange factor 1 n=1 Tax=Brachionus calyciflorus TaxID=104777 RepID=A0A813XLJ3_9BILA|nr:unnamed protein product [Brachionus calyciflorus]
MSNKNQSLRNFVCDKPMRGFNRTYTLPRRFKEKFLTTNTLSFKSPSTKIKLDSLPVNNCLLTKSIDSLNKSIKYLDNVVLKKKYEIISSISTAILECILEIYNLIKLIENSKESTRLKLELNTSLANFIKWSDSILCFTSVKDYENKADFLELIKKSGLLSQHLLTSVQNLINYVQKKSDLNIQNVKTRSLSSSSTSTKIEPSKITININEDNTISKTIETKLDENQVQISTLTKTTTNTDKNSVENNFENFFNLDKLALELSEISTIDSNSKCNYLLKQFESFAKEFSLNEKLLQTSSCYSTLNRSKNSSASCYSSPCHSLSGTTRKKILYKNSKFIHDYENKVELSSSLNENVKKIDLFNTNKINFLETNYLNDKKMSEILLGEVKHENDGNRSDVGEKDTYSNADKEHNLKIDILNGLNPQFENDLNPDFLLIDDDEDEEHEKNDELLLVVDNNKNSFSSDSVSNSSLSLVQNSKKINENLNVNINFDMSNLSLNQQSPIQSTKTDNLQSESSLSESSNLSNSSNLINTSANLNILSLLDVSHLLEYQSSSCISNLATPVNLPNSSILRGGEVDALIVLATSASSSVIAPPANNSSHSLTSNLIKNDKTGTSFLFQEAFLTTYRTILEPIDLIKKLIYRYRFFTKKIDMNTNIDNKGVDDKDPLKRNSLNMNSFDIEFNEKFDLNRLKSNIRLNKMTSSAVRNSLNLLVRILDGLRTELDNKELIDLLNNFIFELVIDDELQMARLLRKKLLNKLEKRRLEKLGEDETNVINDQTDSHKIISTTKAQIIPYSFNTKKAQTILDFKSIDIAEQMTLIDLKLFDKIELSEVLLWSTKQNEKLSPNLIKFTEHFNSISYWARSRILEPENYRDRERHLMKFLKIMKHLRKMNNFNSYLSILSAVDSGPIQRLDWPKHIIDTIKEYAALIDPKCGFKTLREAISEAEPPCIPHIGLILQDLTILHIANPDYLPSGNCNFWKRWQQFNILERLRYFKRCNYNFKPNSKIQELFNDFKDYIGEDAQYTLSEQLKPRIKH